MVDALAPHGLTLQNFASISEQQMGGFLQVLYKQRCARSSAHGSSGPKRPPDMVYYGEEYDIYHCDMVDCSFVTVQYELLCFGMVTRIT